ncbi:protein of unknown function [Singulisphaera sp. GP187]|uniref:DUF4062 domain-containing protein n=1 Tax=Singulisphaera sp. GP187 TaxID=1882752 RepID=UPI00092A5C3A|nr:DUF4062 domain-containing protein [Singulisphaera sp. GP187]SIO35415.1 protein of unknown function [Singulisphaera sp. GP187]
MPRQESILSVFVASPSDVSLERTRLEEVIGDLNHTWSRSLGVRLDLVRWETHAYPGFGEDAQDVINQQLPDDIDIFIGIMWHRFGTPTGRAESGTQEEFLRAKARWDQDNSRMHLMFYFKDTPVSPSQVDAEQLGRVADFRKSLGDEGGLHWRFESPDDFANLMRLHLARVVQDWQSKAILPQRTKSTREESAASMPNDRREPPEEVEVGLFELNEQFEDSFNEANIITLRIAKSTEAIGNKLVGHTTRTQMATNAGQVPRALAKQIIAKAAKDMNDYAMKLDRDVPKLRNLMQIGLSALSQAISLWPELYQNQSRRDEAAESFAAIQSLQSTLSSVETQIRDFLNIVASLPSLTSELNKAKRAVSSSLRSFITTLNDQQKLLMQIEKSAAELHNFQEDIQAADGNVDAPG